MSYIIFKNMVIEGFGSIQKPLNIDLDKGGVWRVQGSNGSGKTTIFSAFVWCLYKMNLKGISSTQVSTWEDNRLEDSYKGTRVMISFDIDETSFLLVRHLNFKGQTFKLKGGSKSMILKKSLKCNRKFEQGDLVTKHLHEVDIQNYITDLIGLDGKTFLNSILFGQRMAKLIDLDNTEKRVLFENLFELDFIKLARDNALVYKEDILDNITSIDTFIQASKVKIDGLKDQYSSTKQVLDNFLAEKKHNGDKIESMISELYNSISSEKIKLKVLKDFVPVDNSKAIKGLKTDITNLKSKLSSSRDSLRAQRELIEKQKNKAQSIRDKEVPFRKSYNKYLAEGNDLEIKFKEIKSFKKINESKKDSLIQEIDKLELKNTSLKNEVKNLKDSLLNIKRECHYCSAKLSDSKIQIVKEGIQSEIKEVKNKIVEIESSIGFSNKSLLDINDVLYSSIKSLEDLNTSIESNKKYKDKEYNQLEHIQDSLNKCYEEQNRLQSIEEDCIKTINSIETDIVTKEEKLNDLSNSDKLFEENKININKCETGIKILNERIEGFKQRLEYIKSEKPPYTDQYLEDLRKNIENIEADMALKSKELISLRKEVELVDWWLNKGFSGKGIKAYVFNSMLSQLNKSVQKYAHRLGISVKFSVDMSKQSKPFKTTCFKDNIEIDYKELSGGEKQRVDLTLAFAMHDLITFTNKFNLLIMDECFEGLDVEGLEVAFDLIRMKAHDSQTIYIISHSMVIDSLNSKVLEVSKDKFSNTVIV